MEFSRIDTAIGGYNFYAEHKRLSNAFNTSIPVTPPFEMNLSKPRKAATFPGKSNYSNPTFVHKRGRKYMEDGVYPLPYDHDEYNRQTIRHLLYHELFGNFHVAEFPTVEDIPHRVLDVGCGNGIWSASMYDSFTARGRKDVQFVGLDIVPISFPNLPNFSFVLHDFLHLPFPFENDSFDYIFCREISMCIPNTYKHDQVIEEYMRILRPGGTLEIQCSDHAIRCLLPSSMPCMASTGAYHITSTTQFNQRSQNPFIQDWNKHIGEVLMRNNLSAVPCTLIHPLLLMETKSLTSIQHRRFAIPLDENWEDNVNNTSMNSNLPSVFSTRPVTPPPSIKSKDDSITPTSPDLEISTGPYSPPSPVESTITSSSNATIVGNPSNTLTEDGKALRILARKNFADMIKSLEPSLKEANHITQDDWDNWYYAMLGNFFREGGLRNGECLEVGAWWGRKIKSED